MNLKKTILSLSLCLGISCASAQQQFEVDLWAGNPIEESSDPADTAKIYAFLPPAAKATGRAVIICPGGSYSHLALDHEGKDWAPFFNRMGTAVFVLKYRMPHGNRKVPVSDVEQAMRMVRVNAKKWNVNANDVGIMGFSAGGHLASTLATHAKEDVMPDFQILFYPVITMDPAFTHKKSHDNFLGERPRKKEQLEYSNDVQVSRVSPRALIILSDDDNVVVPANGMNYYTQLYKHDVPASIMVYPSGGHGWGMKPTFPFHTEMLMNVRAWLDSF